MITRGFITLYHKTKGRTESWTKYSVKAWYFGGHGSRMNKGLVDANDLQIRIPYGLIAIGNIAIGDLVIIGEGQDITKTSDLSDYYTITSINDNNFGNSPHIHLGAR
jgi:hypothetical protein